MVQFVASNKNLWIQILICLQTNDSSQIWFNTWSAQDFHKNNTSNNYVEQTAITDKMNPK